MNYSIYKFEFLTGVHFGNGMLNDTALTFPADSLFSAMYIEAMKMGVAEQFYQAVHMDKLLISDMFPYVGDTYMMPKPMIYIEPTDRGNSEEKKKYKKLKFLPVEQLESYLDGKLKLETDYMENFAESERQVMASIRNGEEDTVPYHVGVCRYKENNGLYLIMAWKDEAQLTLAEEILESLSYTGIGGKKSSGMGKFTFKKGKNSETLLRHLQKASAKQNILLSTALPRDEELENALEEASYLLMKRSGFVASDHYADELRKKHDLYVFAAGSCFKNRFVGDIYDVSTGGKHPVFRYGKPVFMGV